MIYLNLGFVRPHEVLLLVQIIVALKQQGIKVIANLFQDNRAWNYLQNIGFVDFIRNNFETSTAVGAVNLATALPLFRVEKEYIGEYIDIVRQFFNFHLGDQYDFTGITESVTELLNNVYDHSNSFGAYTCGQFYPQKKMIEIAISDFGIGIPESVNKYMRKIGQPELPAAQAIQWAMQLQNSTKSYPYNQGRGLDNVLAFIKSNGGTLEIRCPKAVLKYEKGLKLKFPGQEIRNFVGTSFVLNLNTDGFPLDDGYASDFDINDFTF